MEVQRIWFWRGFVESLVGKWVKALQKMVIHFRQIHMEGVLIFLRASIRIYWVYQFQFFLMPHSNKNSRAAFDRAFPVALPPLGVSPHPHNNNQSKVTPQILDGHCQLYNSLTTQLKGPNPMKELSIFNQNEPTFTQSPRYNMKNLEYCQDPVSMFLNLQVFIDGVNHDKQMQPLCDHSNTQVMQNEGRGEEMKETEQKGRKKSIFHNFQKHLITLIKKFIKIGEEETQLQAQAGVITQLWAVFMKTRSFNKKILHIIFGVLQNNKIGEENQRLSQQFAEFKALTSEASQERIAAAQEFIREEFVRQAQQLNKITLQSSCHVSRFQEFYEYFQSFIGEVMSGPMTKRMTKNRKYGVVTKLAIKENSE